MQLKQFDGREYWFSTFNRSTESLKTINDMNEMELWNCIHKSCNIMSNIMTQELSDLSIMEGYLTQSFR